MISTNELRNKFIEFFKDSGHQVIPSSSLVPTNDPTLLFTNAGMVQFKDNFLGVNKPKNTRATTVQRCVRAGGKHNDLDNVGYTARHHTFFEMLGNFSFGDYFKRDAINFAWTFLTKVLGLPAEKLWVTVFETDTDAEDIWLNEMKIDPKRFSKCGEADNFWSMGDTGPCGPCSEIFYDHGEGIAGDPPGLGEEGDRYIEIWNLVFMEFNRASDGKLTPLPKPSVDTGMGLERISAVMQNVHDNYHIDVFQDLMTAAARVVGVENKDQTSLRVIADHIRSTCFLVMDGVTPSNEGRGYVLRRIIRRAIRHGHHLGQNKPFFFKLVPELVKVMGEAYPELEKQSKLIQKVLNREEEQFLATLDDGMKILTDVIRNLDGKIISGESVFQLYDTYGFPPDLTADIAREHGLQIDEDGFEEAMAAQRAKSQAASTFKVSKDSKIQIEDETKFSGYHNTSDKGNVVSLIINDEQVGVVSEGEQAVVILDRTPFYAESGGQVGDAGYIKTSNCNFKVIDTKKLGKAFAHIGILESGELKLGEEVSAEVNSARRQAIMLNHSATHLLHSALHKVLGEHAKQKGSLVEPDRLRFDFVHFDPLTRGEIVELEKQVNAAIRQNIHGEIHHMSVDEAKEAGATVLFGERYGDKLRVLQYGDVSMEPCGGTHVQSTGDIGFFKIISEEGVASGVRRIVACTGQGALDWAQKLENSVVTAAKILKSDPASFNESIKGVLSQLQEKDKTIDSLMSKLISMQVRDIASRSEKINGISVVVADIPGAHAKSLREAVDQLKSSLGDAVILLAAINDGKVQIIGGVTDGCVNKVKAGDLVRFASGIVGGKGGGKPTMAQGGGANPGNLTKALSDSKDWIVSNLEN